MTVGLCMTPDAYAEFLRKRQGAPVSAKVRVPAVAPKPPKAAHGLSAEDTKVLRVHRAILRIDDLLSSATAR